MDFCLLFDNFNPSRSLWDDKCKIYYIFTVTITKRRRHSSTSACCTCCSLLLSLEDCAAWEKVEKLKFLLLDWGLIVVSGFVEFLGDSFMDLFPRLINESENIENVAELREFYYLIMENKLIFEDLEVEF